MTEVHAPSRRRRLTRAAVVATAATVVLAATATSASAATSDGFNPGPSRILDTRADSPDRPAGPVTGFVQVQLPDSVADGDGALLSITVVNPTSNGNVAAYADGTSVPPTSDVNFVAGPTIAQAVVVPAATGATGKIDLQVSTTGAPIDLVVDVIGSLPAKTYSSLSTAARSLDTRDGTGIAKGAKGAGVYPVTLPTSIPSSATAVAVTLTQVNGTGNGFVSALSSADDATGDTSSLNYTASSVNSNLVFVKPTNGQIFLQVGGAATDLIVDVKGFTTSSAVSAIAPVRVADSRGDADGGLFGQGTIGVTLPDDAPAGASFALLNVTSTQSTQVGYLASIQAGEGENQTSNLNWAPGQDVAGFVVAPVVDGEAQIYIGAGETKLIADVEGYITNAAS